MFYKYVVAALIGAAIVRPKEAGKVLLFTAQALANHPDNLELWVTSQPSGQRPEDLVQWAVDIIERYGASYGTRTAQVG